MVTIDRPPTHTHLAPAVSLVVDNSLQIFSLFDGYLGGVGHTPQVAFDQWDDQYIDKDLKKIEVKWCELGLTEDLPEFL